MKAGLAIYNILSNDGTVAPLVTESGVKKIFPLQIVQRYGYPAIVYTPVSNSPNDTKSGRSLFDQVRIQVDVYSESYSEAATIDDAVRDALDHYNSSQPADVGGVTVRGISYLNTNEAIEEEDNIYRISTDYQIIIDPTS